MITDSERIKITVKGIVQGVGFRPAIARQAAVMGLSGKVCNTRDSVEIEIQGNTASVNEYIDTFNSFTPPNAVIHYFNTEKIDPIEREESFTIIESRESGPTRFSIPPDLAMCDSCREEFYNSASRRYLYPFITCGNCGPRYTYMRDMPYDRKKTSMISFPFCTDCRSEYDNPSDNRYHIEGFSCPACGPVMSGFEEAVNALLEGKIAAVKGLGGYNIVCSAIDCDAVGKLRRRKKRPGKPFAVMFRSIESARDYVILNADEEKLLASGVSPIVIARKKEKSGLAENVAPDNGYLGIMIPYTPMHQLILDSTGIPLVMTSANISGDPLVIDDGRALEKLADIVDVFLTHNREIYKRADDSISCVHGGREISIRMGRGKMPYPVKLRGYSGKKILAAGAELKSNISVVSDDNLVTSNHIGDLGTPDTFTHYIETVKEMCEFYNITPDTVIADEHPDYESTVFAREYCEKNGSRLMQVQHHYAHFLSCYFENNLTGRAAGIILDGTGYGTDGTVWGGEILTGDLNSFERAGRLSMFPLPGGERSIREPWRILSGLLDENQFLDACSWVDRGILENIIKISGNSMFAPLTSSAGRLFDAAGALLGFKRNVSYEAEAAIYLEMLALQYRGRDSISVPLGVSGKLYEYNASLLIKELYLRKKSGVDLTELAGIFHNSLIDGTVNAAVKVCSENSIDQVVLSGGVFQNRIMLEGVEKKLATMGLRVFINRQIPANDAGISAGQAIYGVYNA